MDEAERLAFLGRAKLAGFKRKVDKSKELIKKAIDVAPAYVSCSWGKDSIVMLNLVQDIKPDILVLHYASPESAAGITANFPDVIARYREQFPHTNYRELVALPEWANTPDTIPDRLALILPPEYKLAFVGLRKQESRPRRIALRKYGTLHQYQSGNQRGTWRCCPLADWRTEDIWTYIISRNLPYLDTYDKHPSGTNARTNPHARFWYNKDTMLSQSERAALRKHNPELDNYLKRSKF